MRTFEGTFNNSVDDKGRVAIPARHRGLLKELGQKQVMVTYHFVDPNPCLDLYTMPEWEKLGDRLDQMTGSFGEARTYFESVYIGQAQSCQLDGQGRILIPQSLRTRAKLAEEVTFVGSRNKIRIFRSEAYEDIVEAYQDMMRQNRNALGDLGI
ncbi:MAG: division/cell wall cluster transcriptional repressor MraZ [Candidatus Binatia bacterium]|nr:division/cell wall cluster transcriptional repressor MraZ [Candidatus Binatia bacterium]